MTRPAATGVGPWHVAEAEPYTINEVFRQIEEQVNLLRGLGVAVNLSIALHAHNSATSGGRIDHGALLGLGDNDHPQYLLASAVTTDEGVEEAASHDRVSDQVMVDATLTLTEQADGSGDAVQLKLANTSVTPGTYGDAANVSQITVDQQGRLTSATNVAIVVTATEANDVGFIDADDSASRLVDQVLMGEDLALTELAEGSGDAISLDVATAQTLDDGQGGAAQGFETVVDGLGDFGVAIDATSRLHLQGVNRFRHLNSQARVYRTTTQAITTATVTAIQFDNEQYDTDGIHDNVTNNTRLTCQVAGKYAINGTVELDGIGANQLFLVRIQLNGTGDILAEQRFTTSTNDVQIANVTTEYNLAVNDYVELKTFHTAGADRNTGTDAQLVNFSMAYIGE